MDRFDASTEVRGKLGGGQRVMERESLIIAACSRLGCSTYDEER
jgi:hypothetical protein